MKPKSPFIQPYEALPDELPIFPLENALLPGGELPLELAMPHDLALFFDALKSDQLIGMIQPRDHQQPCGIHTIGCAGRIRQYRERKDGRLNIMLTGICRYKLIEELPATNGYRRARVDWGDFKQDYETEDVAPERVAFFKDSLRNYFERHKMQVDWNVLDKLPIEQVANNLVLVMNLDIGSKQRLLESPTLIERLALFSELLEQKPDPITPASDKSNRVN